MIYVLKRILPKEECASFLAYLESADMVDGRVTGGSLGGNLKKNHQSQQGPEHQAQSARLIGLLSASEKVRAVAVPRVFSQPIFSIYKERDHYSAHYDCAAQNTLAGETLRADLSGTLLLNSADDFDGGDLSIRINNRVEKIHLDQGDLVLYQSGLLHEVSPIKSGERRAAVFWVQSLIADAHSRQLVIDYDIFAQKLLRGGAVDQTQKIELSGIYHRMIKQFSN